MNEYEFVGRRAHRWNSVCRLGGKSCVTKRGVCTSVLDRIRVNEVREIMRVDEKRRTGVCGKHNIQTRDEFSLHTKRIITTACEQ